jgi:hypothetical protein
VPKYRKLFSFAAQLKAGKASVGLSSLWNVTEFSCYILVMRKLKTAFCKVTKVAEVVKLCLFVHYLHSLKIMDVVSVHPCWKFHLCNVRGKDMLHVTWDTKDMLSHSKSRIMEHISMYET